MIMEFSGQPERVVTTEQVELAGLAPEGVVRAFVAVDGGPRFVIDFEWRDLATIAVLSNGVLERGACALTIITFLLNHLFAPDLERWQHMTGDARAVELISRNLPIV